MMKRGRKDTFAALAVGGGLIAVIVAVEHARARAGAPVVTRGGRWTQPRGATFVGLDVLEDIADLGDSIATAVADAIIDESDGALDPRDRPSVIAVVLNAMKRYQGGSA